MGKHNELRRTVAKGLESRGVGGGQPKAADMFELSWDPVLATSAQRSHKYIFSFLRQSSILYLAFSLAFACFGRKAF